MILQPASPSADPGRPDAMRPTGLRVAKLIAPPMALAAATEAGHDVKGP